MKSNVFPHWFKETSKNSISRWIVAKFESRIVECYYEKNIDYDHITPIEMKDEYNQIWNGLSEHDRYNLINKSVDLLDQFKKCSYSSGDISILQNFKNRDKCLNFPSQSAIAKDMNWNEVMLKIIWQMNKDIIVYESINNYELIKNHFKNCIHTHSKNSKKNFIFMCISPTLTDSLKIERFFMNLLMRFVHDLYIEKNINDLCNEENNDNGEKKKNNKKKKRNRKKNKNKKQEQEQIQIETIDLKSKKTYLENDFLDKIKEKIRQEGDKNGLLVPLLHAHDEDQANVEIVTEDIASKKDIVQNAADKIKNIIMLDTNINNPFKQHKNDIKTETVIIEKPKKKIIKETPNKPQQENTKTKTKPINLIKEPITPPTQPKTKNKSKIQKEFLEKELNSINHQIKNEKSIEKKIIDKETPNMIKFEDNKEKSHKKKIKEEKKEYIDKPSKKNKKYKYKLKRSNKEKKVIPIIKKDHAVIVPSSQNKIDKFQSRNLNDKKECVKEIKNEKNNLDKKINSEINVKVKLPDQTSKLKKWTQDSEHKVSSVNDQSEHNLKTKVKSEISKKKNKKKKLSKNSKWVNKPRTVQKWGQEESKPINFVSVKQNSASTHNNPFINHSKSFKAFDPSFSNNVKFTNSDYNMNLPLYYNNPIPINPLQHNLIPPTSSINPLQSLNDPLFFNATHNHSHSEKLSMESFPQEPYIHSREISQNTKKINILTKSEKQADTSPIISEINQLINIKKKEINNSTKEAFYEFTSNSIKKIVSELKSQAEQLQSHREIILKRINKIVHKSFKTEEVNVIPYGSFETGLLTPSSDLDLAITFSSFTTTSIEQKHYFLETLENNLKLFSFVKKSEKVLSATVPVIKIEADASIEFKELSEKTQESRIIKVDIIVGSHENNGDINTAFKTTNFIKHELNNYPSLFEVLLFFKYVLTSHGLSNAFKGGFNAYGFSILVIAFMKFYSLEKSPDVGRITLEFLHFFCNIFQPNTTAVNYKYSELASSQPFIPYDTFMTGVQLLIFDPTSIIPKNVTASCYKFYQIKDFFSQCLNKILNAQTFMEFKLLKKLEETLNKGVSANNRLDLTANEHQNITQPNKFSKSIQENRLSMTENRNNSLILSNCEKNSIPIRPINDKQTQFEVLSQDNHKTQIKKHHPDHQIKETESVHSSSKTLNKFILKNNFILKNSELSSETKLEEGDRERASSQKGIKCNEKRLKDEQVQMQNMGQFVIDKGNLVKFFDDMYSDLYEIVFSLNGKGIEQQSGCESVVHEKLQTDLNFDQESTQTTHYILINNSTSKLGNKK